MALSEREKEVLRDLEAQLGSTDPDLAASMSDSMGERSELGWRPSPRHVGMGVFAVIWHDRLRGFLPLGVVGTRGLDLLWPGRMGRGDCTNQRQHPCCQAWR